MYSALLDDIVYSFVESYFKLLIQWIKGIYKAYGNGEVHGMDYDIIDIFLSQKLFVLF